MVNRPGHVSISGNGLVDDDGEVIDDLRVQDIIIDGEILTGTFADPGPFRGIEREGRVFPAGEMVSSTAVMNFGDGFPRLNMPAGDTTDAYMIFEVEEWWLHSTIGVYFEWANDHTATGDVRWSCDVKQVDIGSALSTAVTLSTRTFTISGVPANGGTTTSIVGSVLQGNPVDLSDPGPGAFASFYRLRISRLGADAADTLAGPVGLIAASMTRGQ